jgi:hypothetical protein
MNVSQMNKLVNMNVTKIHKQISHLMKASLLCIIFLSTNFIHSDAFDDDEFDTLLSSVTQEDLKILRTCEAGEALLWNSFLTDAGIPQALNQQFYFYTSLPRTRNIIDFPEFQLCSYQDMDSRHQFTFHIFYNATVRKNYTQSENCIDGTRIDSYLNIKNGTFLQLIENATASSLLPAQFAPLRNFNYPLLFSDLANARLEERRLGVLAHYYQKIDSKTYFEAKLPFLYMIKNFNFTQKEKNRIRQQFILFTGGGSSSFDETEFTKQHLIFDALGTGTMELSLSTRLWTHEDHHKHADAGIFVFLPTDYQFARGLYGTYIQPCDQQPILDLCYLVQDIAGTPIMPSNAGAILNDYFYDALDQLSATLLQCPLGYHQTVTLGLKLSPYWKIREDLEFNGLYTVEFLLPYKEKRFFNVINSGNFLDEYAALPTGTNALENAKLLFLETRLTELLFPRVFTTHVSPGFIITSASNIQKSYKGWDFTVGYSGWVQLAEQFYSVKIPRGTDIRDFDIENSMSNDAYQVKIFGKFHRDIHTTRHDVSLTLWADATVWNNNIGNDFSLGICFDKKF